MAKIKARKAPGEAILEDMVNQAIAAPSPGEVRAGMVVDKGGDESPPMVVSSVKEAGYIYVWDTVTHEPSIINRNMLKSQLKKTREDGSKVFTIYEPKEQPRRGAIKCLLHPDDLNRQHYDEIGFTVCHKRNLVSTYQLEQHMKHCHKAEWAGIEKERLAKEKEEEREFQRMLIMRGASSGSR